jgi:hypothetical protein
MTPRFLPSAFLLVVVSFSVLAAETRPGFTPLNQLGAEMFHGFTGGLYAGGRNEPHGAHAEALARVSGRIQPLNADGKSAADGKIVVMGIGASVCRQIFAELERTGAQAAGINPAVVFVNGAKGGADVNKIADARYWETADKALQSRGVTAAQVQVIWYQSDNLRDQEAEFPARPQKLMEEFAAQTRLMKEHFPNAQICYHSGRHTTAFIPDPERVAKHTEPRPYHHGWAVKWLIEAQTSGRADLQFEGEKAVAPLSAWATYFWTNGDEPRADGYRWMRDDVVKDGVHLSDTSIPRVAKELTDFWSRDEFARRWFLTGGAQLEKVSTPAAASVPVTTRAIAKHAGSDSPAWIINGMNKMPKLERLLATTDGVRVIVRKLDGKVAAEVSDVFGRHTDLNQLVGTGEYRLEFYAKDGKRIALTKEVGEVLRLK